MIRFLITAFALLVSAAWAAPRGNAFFSGADSTGYAKTAINTNLPSGASPRSISFWFLITPATDSAASPVPVPVDGFFYLLDIGSSASSYQTNNEWAVSVSPSSASMGSSYPSPSNSISALNISGCVNVWTHAAVVFRDSATSAYVNGVLVSQFLTGQTFGTDTNLELWLGARPAGLTLCTPACPGRGPGLWIDEVRVWNYTLSSSDVVADMTTATPSNSASNKAWYSFDSAVAGATSAVSGTSDATALTFSGAASVAVAPTQFVVIGAPASGVVPTAQSPLCTNVTVTSPSGGLSWGVRLQSNSVVIDNLTSWSDRAYSSSSNQVFSYSSTLYLSDSKTSGILQVCASSSQTWTLNVIVHLSVFSCASGQYGSQCQTCTAGSYCARAAYAPTTCPAGSYCAAGVTAPALCNAGWYCNTTGLANFSQICPLGTYCPSGSIAPSPCSAGSYCPVGSSSENLCEAGFYCATPSLKQPCSSIYYCPAGTYTLTRCSLGITLVSSQFQSISRSNALQLITKLTKTVGSNPCFLANASVTNVSYIWDQMTPAKLGFTQTPYSGTISVAGNSINVSNIATDLLNAPMSGQMAMFPAFVLTSGKTYIFQLKQTASVVGYCSNIVSSVVLAVAVTRVPLVAIMAGGNRTLSIAVSNSQALRLDATGSYDPDVVLAAGASNSDLRYMWACLRPNSFRTCSVGTGFPVSTPTLVLAASYFSESDIWEPYVFYVIVSSVSDGRSARSNNVQIQAVAVNVPTASISVSVSSQGTSWKYIFPTDSVRLGAVLSDSTKSVTFLWTCTSGNLNIAPGSAAISSSATSSVLSIVANSLSPGAYYSFSLRVCSATSVLDCSLSSISFVVNQIPYGGTCTMQGPAVGLACVTVWTMTCSGWLDASENFPLSYGLQQTDSLDTSGMPLVVVSQQSGSNFTFMLQAGSPVLMRVVIQDIFGGQAFVPFSVNVTNPDLSTMNAFQAAMGISMSMLHGAVNHGDPDTLAQVISAVTQMLSVAANQTGQLTADAIAIRAATRSSMINAMADMTNMTASAMTSAPTVLSQFAGQVFTISSVPTEMSVSSTVTASNMIKTVVHEALNKPSSSRLETSTAEVVVMSVSNLLTAMDMDSTGSASKELKIQVAEEASTLIQSVGRGVLIGVADGQKVVSTPQVTVVASRSSASQLTQSSTQFKPSDSSADIGVVLPPTVLAEAGLSTTGQIDAVFSSMSSNSFAVADNASSVSTLVSFTLFSSSQTIGNSALNVSGLQTPILITIPHGPLGNYTTVCRFWDEIRNVWSTDGCTVVSVTSNSTVCACTHLTTFNLAKALSPQVTVIRSQDVLNFFNWGNIVAHPIPIICCATIVALWIILSHCIQKSEIQGTCCCFDQNRSFKSVTVISDDDVDVELAALAHSSGSSVEIEMPSETAATASTSIQHSPQLCFDRLDRRTYGFPLSTASPIASLMNQFIELHRLKQFNLDVSLLGLIVDPHVWHIFRTNIVSRILSMHPFLNVWFHHPADPYTSYQRLQVVVAAVLSMMAVSAAFYGINPVSLEAMASVSIYSALLALPVNFIFPRLFISVANQRQAYVEERRTMKLLNIKLPPTDLSNVGVLTLRIAHMFLWLWTAGCIFVCLVYGMQFDLMPAAQTTTTTSTLGSVSSSTTQVVRPASAQRDLPVSLQWLFSVFSSLAMDVVISAPVAIVFGVLVATMRARYALGEEILRRSMLSINLQVKWEDIVFSEERVDEFASWIHHDLTWAPNFGQDAVDASTSTLPQSTEIETETTLGSVHKFGKTAGVALIQSLAFGMIGGGAVMPIDLSAPSLGDEISFVAKSAVSIPEARRQAEQNSNRIEFDDSTGLVQNQVMHPVRMQDPPNDLVITLSVFNWTLRLQNARPSQTVASELRIMHALRTAWVAVSASVRLSFVFDADWRRVSLERDLFSRLFLGDLAFACGVTQSRFVIVDMRRWYGKHSSSQHSYDKTVVTVDIIPERIDRSRAVEVLQKLDRAIAEMIEFEDAELRAMVLADVAEQPQSTNRKPRNSVIIPAHSAPKSRPFKSVKTSAYDFDPMQSQQPASFDRKTRNSIFAIPVEPVRKVHVPAPLPAVSVPIPEPAHDDAAAGPLAALFKQHHLARQADKALGAGPLSELLPPVAPPVEVIVTPAIAEDDSPVVKFVKSFASLSRVSSSAPKNQTSMEIAFHLRHRLKVLAGGSIGFWLTSIHVHQSEQLRQETSTAVGVILRSLIDQSMS